MCFQVSVATRHHLKHCVRPACSGFAPVVAGSAKNASPAPKGVRLISHPLGAPMFARALLAFLVLPCVVAVLAPPLIAFLDPWRGRACTPGLAVMLAGAIVLLWCVRDFYVSGKGTLAPWDPPEKLVVIGLYRYVRNPMYVGVLLLVFGWAHVLLFACPRRVFRGTGGRVSHTGGHSRGAMAEVPVFRRVARVQPGRISLASACKAVEERLLTTRCGWDGPNGPRPEPKRRVNGKSEWIILLKDYRMSLRCLWGGRQGRFRLWLTFVCAEKGSSETAGDE